MNVPAGWNASGFKRSFTLTGSPEIEPANWELSSARASSVVRLFIDQGIVAKRLKAVGSADNHPVLPNDSAEGRARNRRVTITVLNPQPEAEPASTTPPSAEQQ